MKEVTLEARENLLAGIINGLAKNITTMDPTVTTERAVSEIVSGIAEARVMMAKMAGSQEAWREFLNGHAVNHTTAITMMLSMVVDRYLDLKNATSEEGMDRVDGLKECATAYTGNVVDPVSHIAVFWHAHATDSDSNRTNPRVVLAMKALRDHAREYHKYIQTVTSTDTDSEVVYTAYQLIGACLSSYVVAYEDACAEQDVTPFVFNEQSLINTAPPTWWKPSQLH